jgi:hypothetical protein
MKDQDSMKRIAIIGHLDGSAMPGRILVIPDDPSVPVSLHTVEQISSFIETVPSFKIEAPPLINLFEIEKTGREKRRERRKRERALLKH